MILFCPKDAAFEVLRILVRQMRLFSVCCIYTARLVW